ncbi:hypothetical protein BGX38DRAFT_1144652 [Terfezia claveryi]|nr:hypothetical protein BGX38DRAFT_1144652 [Terfezia claveryi]
MKGRRILQNSQPGRNYLKTVPLSSSVRIGDPTQSPRRMLNDVCSNISLIDHKTLIENYPNTIINAETRVEIHGIGRSGTIGFCSIPIWLEGYQGDINSQERCLIEIEAEFHVLEDFSYGILLGVDALTDYGIDLMISKGRACAEGFSYDVEYTDSKFRSVLVRLKEDMTVGGRTCRAIPIKSHMLPDRDYVFAPHQFVNQGAAILPSLSLPYAVTNSNVKFLMFQNSSTQPIHLKKNQVIGRATMGDLSMLTETGISMDWADLVRPGPRRKNNGNRAPTHVSTAFYDSQAPETAGTQTLTQELNFLADIVRNDPSGPQRDWLAPSESLAFNAEGQENSRQRSITEDELWKRIGKATTRPYGELPDPKLEDELPLFGPIPTGLPEKDDTETNKEKVSKDDVKMGEHLSDAQKEELFGLVLDFLDVFSKGARLSKVKGYKATLKER